MLRNFGMIVSALAIGMAITAGASASTNLIIDDTYTAADSTPLSSHAPATNLPGGSYQIGNADLGIGEDTAHGFGVGFNTANYPIPVHDVARVGQDSAFAISLESNVSYTKPTVIMVSADINLEAMEPGSGGNDIENVGDTGLIGGVGLGFYPDAATVSATIHNREVTGIDYSDDGKLLLIQPVSAHNGNDIVDAAASTYDGGIPIPTTGTHTLAYTVDTGTGAISNVTFDGFAITFTSGTVPTGLFTDAVTNYIGEYSRSGSNNDYGFLDNLVVTTPEPASMSLLVVGGVMLLGRRRRRSGARAPLAVSRNVGILVSALAVLMAITAGASATTVVLDTFDDAATVGNSMVNRTPTPIDIPGDTYTVLVHQGASINASGQAVMGADTRAYLDITSLAADPYVTISATLRYDNESHATPANGAALGFWQNTTDGNGLTNFTGVALGLAPNGDGALNLMSGATFNVTSSIDLGGAFDNSALHILTYTITRSSDTITSLTLDGTPYTFSNNAAVFTLANTPNAGIGAHGVTSPDTATFDNFTLIVPEPASMGLLAVGGLMLLRRRR